MCPVQSPARRIRQKSSRTALRIILRRHASHVPLLRIQSKGRSRAPLRRQHILAELRPRLRQRRFACTRRSARSAGSRLPINRAGTAGPPAPPAQTSAPSIPGSHRNCGCGNGVNRVTCPPPKRQSAQCGSRSKIFRRAFR
jgi:hypothetical protein